MRPQNIFAGLNAEQRRAAETTHGPVCILAGAGSGKTTTITRRIANQVLSGAFRPTEILALTFARKAAEEMKLRLAQLGATGVPARTFHSAAHAQLAYFDGSQRVLESKIAILLEIRHRLPKEYRTRSVSDFATEIEWAKNRRLTPDTYLAEVNGRTPPLPTELMTDVFREYERRKGAVEKIDHEDQLERTIRLFEEQPAALAEFRHRYRAFTVDEYQDVNLLQQTLLDLWLGDRTDLCVVGDDYQSIYGFTGAGPEYLLAVPGRFADATVIRLEENYRSTPEVLGLANRLVPRLGGARKVLLASSPAGQRPVLREVPNAAAEVSLVASTVMELHRQGVALRDIAVLYRANFRSEDYEEVLEDARIAYQVRDGGLLDRRAAKVLLRRLRGATSVSITETVRRAGVEAGYLPEPSEDLGAAELTRQNDLARLIRLAADFDDGEKRVVDFVAHLEERFSTDSSHDAVQLLTYHSAKGLEFEAVILPRLEERELPYWRAIEAGTIDEERRLFYVGLTRAKKFLYLTWSRSRPRSRFLDEIDPPVEESPPSRPPRKPRPPSDRKESRNGSHTTGERPRLSPDSWRPF